MLVGLVIVGGSEALAVSAINVQIVTIFLKIVVKMICCRSCLCLSPCEEPCLIIIVFLGVVSFLVE